MSSEKQLSFKRTEVRNRIITAAGEVFKTNGFQASSISAIAKKAKVADGTIYLYFKNKEELFIVVLDLMMEDILDNVHDQVKRVDNPIEKILKFYDVIIESFTNNHSFAKMAILEVNQVKKGILVSTGLPSYYKYLNYISNLCHQAIRKGFIREIDTESFSIMVFSCIEYIIRLWIYSDYKTDTHKLRKKVLNILIYGIIRY